MNGKPRKLESHENQEEIRYNTRTKGKVKFDQEGYY